MTTQPEIPAGKTIRLRRYSFDPDRTVEVTLVDDFGDTSWNVYLNGTRIGRLTRSEGYAGESRVGKSMIRTRKRVIRTLWGAYSAYTGGTRRNSYESRAAAIRSLLADHDYEQKQES